MPVLTLWAPFSVKGQLIPFDAEAAMSILEA